MKKLTRYEEKCENSKRDNKYALKRLCENTKDSIDPDEKSESFGSGISVDFNAFKNHFKTLKRADFTNLFNIFLNVCPLEKAKGKDQFKMDIKKIEFGAKQRLEDFESDNQYS